MNNQRKRAAAAVLRKMGVEFRSEERCVALWQTPWQLLDKLAASGELKNVDVTDPRLLNHQGEPTFFNDREEICTLLSIEMAEITGEIPVNVRTHIPHSLWGIDFLDDTRFHSIRHDRANQVGFILLRDCEPVIIATPKRHFHAG